MTHPCILHVHKVTCTFLNLPLAIPNGISTFRMETAAVLFILPFQMNLMMYLTCYWWHLTIHLDLNLRNNLGETVLHIAAKRDSIELCQKIVAKEIDPNIQNNDGETPLHIAANSENGNIAVLLLNLGQCYGNVNLQDNFGETATHIAAKKHCPAVLHRLLRNKSCNPYLQSACGVTVLQIATDQNDITTVLQIATDQNGITAVQLLLSNKHATYQQINLQDDSGDTAPHIATRNHHIKIAELLLSQQCASDIQDVAGRTPLHNATISLNSELIHLLIESGCNPNIQDNQGNTALHILTYKADFQVHADLQNVQPKRSR